MSHSCKKLPKRWPYIAFALLTGTSIAVAATQFTCGQPLTKSVPLASATSR